MRMRHCHRNITWFLALVWWLGHQAADTHLTVLAAHEPLGPNLIPNGSYEQWTDEGTPQGWTLQTNGGECAVDDDYRATGTRSARLALTKVPGSVLLTSPTIAASLGWYLVRFTFRVVGLSRSQSYEGGQADTQVFWLGEGNKTLRHDYVAWTYFPLEWSYRDRFYLAPPGTIAIRVAVGISGNPPVQLPSVAWFDDIAVCAYQPPVNIGETVTREWSVTAGQEILTVPGARAWFYLAGKEGSESAQAERVPDPDAMLGWALHAKPGVPEGMVYHSPYTVEQPAGLYRVFFRIKRATTSNLQPTEPLVAMDIISSDSGPRGSRSVTLSEFSKRAQYEDFTFDFVKRTSGWITLRVMTPGKDAEFWLDHVRVVQLRAFSDPDLLVWYPGVGGSLGANPSLERGPTCRVLFVKGLLGEMFRVEEAAQQWRGCELTLVPYSVGQGGPAIQGYPSLWTDLRKFDAIVIANTSLEALGPELRYQLMEFIRVGGGLVLLGGKAAYANGGIRGSFLDKVLPIQVGSERFDLQPATGVLTRTGTTIALDPKWIANLTCPFIHRVTPKPGATVVIRQGSVPVLVTGSFGKGRIACLTAAPYGTASAGKMVFHNSKGWTSLMRNVLVWVCRQEVVSG